MVGVAGYGAPRACSPSRDQDALPQDCWLVGGMAFWAGAAASSGLLLPVLCACPARCLHPSQYLRLSLLRGTQGGCPVAWMFRAPRSPPCSLLSAGPVGLDLKQTPKGLFLPSLLFLKACKCRRLRLPPIGHTSTYRNVLIALKGGDICHVTLNFRPILQTHPLSRATYEHPCIFHKSFNYLVNNTTALLCGSLGGSRCVNLLFVNIQLHGGLCVLPF